MSPSIPLRARFSDGATPDLTAAVRVRFAVPDHRMLAAAEPAATGPRDRQVEPAHEQALAARADRTAPLLFPREPSSNG
ncbi:OTU domain-containing protein OS=Streptomyces fumanus OX=67302 GN=GCM10018772_56770 PE=4 SV=1 [Streptomyces fumanus]